MADKPIDRSWITYNPKTYTTIVNDYAVVNHVTGPNSVNPLTVPGLVELINVFRSMKTSRKETSSDQIYSVYLILDKTHLCIVDLLDIRNNKRYTHKIQYS